MPKIAYEAWTPRFAEAALNIQRAEQICTDYAARGYSLTLRQLYYRFVAAGWIPNTERSYKNLGNLISQARLGGLLDWYHVIDRTRGLNGSPHWEDPGDVVNSAARGYGIDLWTDQDTRVEVWVEKDALVDVVSRAASTWDCSYFSCRGYVSQSEMWVAGRRLRQYANVGQDVVVLHLGDHDPSGIDMTRDITDRLTTFMGSTADRLDVRRIALNMDQIEQYQPPPNPAKVTDSRYLAYQLEHGDESWELDALDPDVLNTLIDTEIASIVDSDLLDARRATQERERALLTAVSRNWAMVASWVEDNFDVEGDDDDT